jgi:hypothetical protein
MSIITVKELTLEFNELIKHWDNVVDDLIDDINDQIKSAVSTNENKEYILNYTLPTDINLENDDSNSGKIYIYGILVQKFIDAGYTASVCVSKDKIYIEVKWTMQDSIASKKYKQSVETIKKYRSK